MMTIYQKTKFVKQRASDLGFFQVGISKAEYMEDEAQRMEQWLDQHRHGTMNYLERYFDKRLDPTKLVPGAKSVISLMYNYYPDEYISEDSKLKISRYALGEDYHQVIKKKLRLLLEDMRQMIGEISGRCFVDSAPVLERDWARRSGLGWIGKNTLLIHPKAGSYFFLAELIIDLELEYDAPIKDYCGTCRRCIDACPTKAIDETGYVMDGSKCISYLTIEHKGKIPNSFEDKMEGWIFGCDICQEVCPWNRFAQPHTEPAFEPSEALLRMSPHDWQEITEEVFRKLFSKSPIKRTKFTGLKRNINFVSYDDKQTD